MGCFANTSQMGRTYPFTRSMILTGLLYGSTYGPEKRSASKRLLLCSNEPLRWPVEPTVAFLNHFVLMLHVGMERASPYFDRNA